MRGRRPTAAFGGGESSPSLACTIPSSEILDGGPDKDGIPAPTNPPLVGADVPAACGVRDAAWYYPQPKDAAARIAGHVAFWRGVTVEP